MRKFVPEEHDGFRMIVQRDGERVRLSPVTAMRGPADVPSSWKLPSVEEKAVADFEAVAETILGKAADTRASAIPLRTSKIPLPRKRPANVP